VDGIDLFISAPQENFEGLQKALKDIATIESHWATVSLTGRGLVASDAIFEIADTLKQNEIPFEGLITTPLSLSFLIHHDKVQKASQLLHEKFVIS
jgi:aspartokinase